MGKENDIVNVTELGHLPRVTNLFPRVIRAGCYENAALIPLRRFTDTQICIHFCCQPDPLTLKINGKEYSVSCPRILIKRCGEIHEISDYHGRVSSFYFVYTSDESIEDLIPSELSCMNLNLTLDMQNLVSKIMKLLQHTGDLGTCDRIDKYCFSLLQEIILHHAAKEDHTIPVEKQIRGAVSYLQTHFCENIDWNVLSYRFGFSERSFTRHWRNSMHCSPKEYVMMLRFIEAKRMLEETNLKISEIALKIGYRIPESFITAFRKKNGISPLAYRRKA